MNMQLRQWIAYDILAENCLQILHERQIGIICAERQSILVSA